MPAKRIVWSIAVGCVGILLSGCVVLTVPGSPVDTSSRGVAVDSTGTPALWAHLQSREGGETDGTYYRPFVAVLPFVDDSGFRRGVWTLENDMPHLLTVEMEPRAVWRMVPSEAVAEVAHKPRRWRDAAAVETGSVLRADIVVLGTILDLNMERLHVGDPLIGGYKSFKGVAELELTAMRVEDGSAIGTVHSREEVIDRGLGLDLLGKPREQDYQFMNLGSMAFGSEAFRETALGQATVMVMGDLVGKLAHLVEPRALEASGDRSRVLSAFGEEIFIGLGSANGVHAGYRFTVRPDPARAQRDGLDPDGVVGVVEILDVIGAGISRVRAVGASEGIRVGDRLDLIQAGPRPEAEPEQGDETRE